MLGWRGVLPRIGRYRVLERLGCGGMAEVFKVSAEGVGGFEKVMALKRILPALAGDARFTRSFIDEARIAAELSQRNIVGVFDFGRADGELYLTMELVDGIDLRQLLATARQRGQAIPIGLVGRIVAELAAGLDYAHTRTGPGGEPLAIVHCDVSPSNVMLSHDGDVKILDFGVARANFVTALEQRRLRGKPRYMAPEQTRGEPPTAAADVFALGVIAWELASGRGLFRGIDLRDTVRKVRTGEVPPLAEACPAMPRSAAAAIERALQRDPAARGTAHDLALALSPLAAPVRTLAMFVAELRRDLAPAEPPPLAPSTTVDGETTRRTRLGDFEDDATRADPDYRADADDLVIELRESADHALPAPAPAPPPTQPTAPAGRPAARPGVVLRLRGSAGRTSTLDDLGRRAERSGGLALRPEPTCLDIVLGLDVPGDDELAIAVGLMRRAALAAPEASMALHDDVTLAARAVPPRIALALDEALATLPSGHAAVIGPSPAALRPHLAALGLGVVAEAGHAGALHVDLTTPAPPPTLDADDAAAAAMLATAWATAPQRTEIVAITSTVDDAVRDAAIAAAVTRQVAGALMVTAPPAARQAPFGLLAAIAGAIGGPLRDVLLRLRAEASLAPRAADARVERLALELAARLWPSSPAPTGGVLCVLDAGSADRASLRVLARASALTATPHRIALWGPRPTDLPQQPGADWSVVSTLQLPRRVAQPPGAPTDIGGDDVLAALVAAGGSLPYALLRALIDPAGLDATLAALVGAGHLAPRTHRGDATLVGLPAPRHDLLRDAQRRLAELLRARDRAGRDVAPAQLAGLLAAIEDPAAAAAWFEAGRLALAAGDARGAIAALVRSARLDPAPAWQRAVGDALVAAQDLFDARLEPAASWPPPPLSAAADLAHAWRRQQFARVIQLADAAPADDTSLDELARAERDLQVGVARLRVGHLTEAGHQLARALTAFDRHGAVEREGHARVQLALLAEAHGDSERAATDLAALAARAVILTSPELLRRLSEAQARVELGRGNPGRAWRHATQMRRMLGVDDATAEGGSELACARVLAAIGQHDAALELVLAALATPTLTVDPHPRSLALLLACAVVPPHAPQRAAWLDEASALIAATGAAAPRLEALLRRAEHADPATAVATLRDAHAAARTYGHRAIALRAAVALASALIDVGARGDADAVLREAVAGFDPRRSAPMDGPAMLAACAAVARRLDDHALADALLARGRQRLRAIALDLDEPDWRVSFLAMPAHAALQT